MKDIEGFVIEGRDGKIGDNIQVDVYLSIVPATLRCYEGQKIAPVLLCDNSRLAQLRITREVLGTQPDCSGLSAE